MGGWTEIAAQDGHNLSVYATSRGQSQLPSLVILQEIFGVTPEMQTLAERFSEHGYQVVVPALYDRIRPNYVLAYDDAEVARAAKNQLRYDEIAYDIRAAISFADAGYGVALLGHCWGGGLAYWFAQSNAVKAVVSYYGTNLAQYCSSPPPEAPCQFHLGIDDPMIDANARSVIRESCRPSDEYFEYEGAGHAFANAARASYREDSAALAESRSLAFLEHVSAKSHFF